MLTGYTQAVLPAVCSNLLSISAIERLRTLVVIHAGGNPHHPSNFPPELPHLHVGRLGNLFIFAQTRFCTRILCSSFAYKRRTYVFSHIALSMWFEDVALYVSMGCISKVDIDMSLVIQCAKKEKTIDRPIDRPTIDRSTDRPADRPTDRSTDQSTDRSTDRQTDRMTSRQPSRPTARSADRSTEGTVAGLP